jgi:hypothetical protein
MSGSWMDRRTGLWPRWIENAVPILVTSSPPDNQLDCIAARMAEAQATTARTVSARRCGCVRRPEQEAGPTSGRMIFHHGTPDNMSFAVRLVMVI